MYDIIDYKSEQIKEILDEISEVIIIAKDMKNYFVNKAFTKLFGYTKEEVIGKGPDLILDKKEINNIIEYFKNSTSKNIIHNKIESFALKKDKTKIFIEIMGKNIKIDGELAQLIEIHDITERIKMIDSLITSEKIYNYSIENTPIPIIIHTDGKIVFINDATKKMIEIEDEKTIIGKDVLSFVHPDFREITVKRIQTMAKTGKLADKAYERFIMPNGKVIDVEVFAFPINFRGKFSYQVYFTDITERMIHEKALKESEQKFRLLFENLPIGIFLYDKEFKVVDVNKSFETIVRTSKERLLGIDVTKLKDKSFLEELKKTKKGEFGFYEGKYITEVSGIELWIIVNTAPIFNTSGDFDGGLCIFTDLTKQKELEAQFFQSQKLEAIGRLTGGIAHDFNNILTVIKGYSELVLKKISNDDKNYKRIEEIKKAGERASELIQQLMTFSKKQIVRVEELDLPQLVFDLKGMINRIIGEEIGLQIKIKGKTGLILADKSQLNQVILNLLVNAKDALEEKDIPDLEKSITLEIKEVFIDDDFIDKHRGSKKGRNISLSVKDNGIGMDKEVADKVFEPFYTTKKSGKGTGLGLSTAYGIIKQNNGYIYVESEKNTKTIFTILFPIISNKSKQSKKSESGNGLSNIPNIKLLVVEDDDGVREYIVEVLKEKGFEVYEAENGEVALSEMKKYGEEIDCVISDIVMPKMDGETLTEIIKEKYPEKKIVLMSGYTTSDALLKKIKERDYNFIKKPFVVEELLDILTKLNIKK